MRNGKMLAEHSPIFLLRHYKVQNLEKVFLEMCINKKDDPNYIEMPHNYIDTLPDNHSIKTNDINQTDGQSVSEMIDSNKNLIETAKKLNNNVENQYKSSLQSRLFALGHKNFLRLIRNKP